MNELHFKRVRKADHQSETPVCREDLFFCLYPTICGHLLIRFRIQKMLWMVLICLSRKSAVTSAVINYWRLERAPYRTRTLAVVLLCCVMVQTDVLYPAVSSWELQQTPTHTTRSEIHSWKQTCRRRDRSTVYFCLDFNPQETKVTLNCVP